MLELRAFRIAGSNGLTTDSALSESIWNAATRGANIISMSLGHTGYSETLQQSVDYAWSLNVVMVASLGNDGASEPSYPGANHHVIGVGAIDSTGALANFSNRGRPVDVVAPGVNVLTTTPVTAGRFQSTYDLVSGTSAAAPHVAALAGLLAMASPGALADEIARTIERSAVLASDGWSSELGYGRIDAERAITGANWRTSTTGSVSGLVRSSAGTPAAVLVTINSATAYTDLGGLFRISGIPPGDYNMTVETLSGPQVSLSVPVTITAGADTPVQVRLGTAYGTLHGTVTASGVPAAGIVVAAMAGTLQKAVAVTNAAGQYRLFVPAGTYSVRTGGLFMTVAQTAEDQVAVAGQTRDVAPLAAQYFGRFEGQVRSAQNAPVQGAQVVLAQSGRSFGGVSGAGGSYRTMAGPAGTYVASAEHETAGVSQPATVSMVDAVTGRLDLVLGPGNQSITLSPTTATHPATIGTGSVNILAGSPQLSWSAASNAAWLTISSPLTGTGSGTLNYSLAYNPDATPRSARITVNGVILTVTQLGSTVPVSLNPASFSFGPSRVYESYVAVSSAGFWSATTQNSWITINLFSVGNGNGSFSFSVEANLTGATRTGAISVNGVAIPITQTGATMILQPTSVAVPAKSYEGANVSVEVTVPDNTAWSASTTDSWITFHGTPSLVGSNLFIFFFAQNTSPSPRTGTITMNNGMKVTVTQSGANALRVTPASAHHSAERTDGSFTVSGPAPWWAYSSGAPWLNISTPSAELINYSIAANPGPGARTATIYVSDSIFTITQDAPVTNPGTGTGGLLFVPVAPCRVADTRENLGPLGKPALAAGVAREFPVTSSGCAIPASAKAYAMNVTVVPKGGLGYLTIFPTGSPQPFVSTLNSIDGRIKANAAIVPAGTNGSISVMGTGATELVLDIFGYFVDPVATPDGLAFYPVAPCRVADTRNPTGGLGGPILSGGIPRSLPVRSSSCGIPATARAYSLNVTVVPSGPLGYLTMWPTGQSQPFVSTLNAPTGAIVANAAIVPAGDSGAISAFATNDTHLVVDINGYFAPAGGPNAQRFFPVSPCRVLDSRESNGSLGSPILAAGVVRTWPVTSSGCNLPPTAQAYSLNATVVPTTTLGYLTMWPAGQAQPFVSTLNAVDDAIVANAAIVVAGTSGSVATFVTNQTHLILDTNGYFAP